ncbi:GGDEF domain-containing protein [Yunchengibacter salinarum]|uniref:GGDEF domain-containing protein n=1 Tax=Yunchengibacter salinarum TaxID=3133399 RepID=UPI0035B5A779
MKVSNSPGISRTTPTRRTGAAERVSASDRTGRASAPSRTVQDTVEVLGIPPEEMTPNVKNAIMTLMSEVDGLRRDLEQSNRRLRELEDLADMDALLPIPNRRAFVRELNRMISFAQRYGTPSTLVFIDMNDMKQINDTFGHEAGDRALFHMARLLVDNTRGTDVVGRLGGDEFGVILAQADETTGREKAAELADMVMATPFEAGGEAIRLNLAYGLYTFRGEDDPNAAIQKADEAMYAHKKAVKGEADIR